MAEAFKEFVNKSFTASDLNSDNQSITLFTNDSNKQAIVRNIDVALDSLITKYTAKLFIGNQTLITSFESASGSLLVDSGQSLTLKLNKAISNQTVTTLDLVHQGYVHNSNAYSYIEYTYTIADTTADFSPTGVSPGLVKGTDYSTDITGFDDFLGSSYHGTLYRNSNGNYWGWYMDTNSISRIVYSTDGSSFSDVDTTTYSGPAVNFESGKIYRKSSSTLGSWDMNTSSTSMTSETGTMHSTNTTYQTGATIKIGNYDYYVHNRQSTSHMGYIKRVGQAGSTNAYFGTYSSDLSSEPKIILAYNSTEAKMYMFTFKTSTWTSSSIAHLSVIPVNLINNLPNNDPIYGQLLSGTDSARYFMVHEDQNSATILGASVLSYSNARDMKHLGGPYVSFPISASAVRVAKCENNALTVVADLDLTWLGSSSDQAANTSHLVGGGPATEVNYTAADVNIASQVRVVGVELS